MDNYTLAQHKWAANRLRIPLEDVVEVQFDMEAPTYGGCDTCGFGADEATFQTIVRLTHNRSSKIIADDPTTVIREICETMEAMCTP